VLFVVKVASKKCLLRAFFEPHQTATAHVFLQKGENLQIENVQNILSVQFESGQDIEGLFKETSTN
jgi:hypothetical protein